MKKEIEISLKRFMGIQNIYVYIYKNPQKHSINADAEMILTEENVLGILSTISIHS